MSHHCFLGDSKHNLFICFSYIMVPSEFIRFVAIPHSKSLSRSYCYVVERKARETAPKEKREF